MYNMEILIININHISIIKWVKVRIKELNRENIDKHNKYNYIYTYLNK